MSIKRTLVRLLPLLICLLPVSAQEQFMDIIVSKFESSIKTKESKGYAATHFTVRNVGDRPHNVSLIATADESWIEVNEIQRSATIDGGSTSIISLLYPGRSASYRCRLLVDGRDSGQAYYLNNQGLEYSMSVSILGDREVSWAPIYETTFQGYMNDPSWGYDANSPAMDFQQVVSTHWPHNWLELTGFDMIFLTGNAYAGLADTQQSALNSWLLAGGVLIVYGEGPKLPDHWLRRPGKDGGVSTFHPGFGKLVIPSEGTGLDLVPWSSLLKEQVSGPASWMVWDGELGLGHSFPLRPSLLVLLGFVILVGPLNLFMLARRNRRMWALITIPLISLVTSLGVIAYISFDAGFGILGEHLSLTILDEQRHTATTMGGQAYFPLTNRGSGLHFSPETAVYSASEANSWRSIDWSYDQHLEAGWLVARQRTELQTRLTEIRRERLTLTRLPDDRLEVVNGLGAPIRWLRLADGDGLLYQFEEIPVGGVARASGISGVSVEDPANLFKNQRDAWRDTEGIQWWTQDFGKQNPHTYVAELEGAPFLPPPPEGCKLQASSWVYGYTEVP